MNFKELLSKAENHQTSVRLNTHFRLLKNDQDHVLVTYFGQRKVLKFAGYAVKAASLLSFLEAPKQIKELLSYLEKESLQEFGPQLLQHLDGMNALVVGEGVRLPESGEDAYFEHFAKSPGSHKEIIHLLKSTEICLISPFDLPASFFQDGIWKNVRRSKTLDYKLDSKMMPVIICGSEDRSFMDTLHHQLQAESRSALLVQLDDFGGFIGPIVGGVGQPCLHCLDQRERSVRTKQSFLRPEKSVFQSHFWPKHFWSSLEGALQSELFKLVAQHLPSETMIGRLVFDFLNNRSGYESVYPVPGCWACQETRADL